MFYKSKSNAIFHYKYLKYSTIRLNSKHCSAFVGYHYDKYIININEKYFS
jgi:hypothetical protein